MPTYKQPAHALKFLALSFNCPPPILLRMKRRHADVVCLNIGGVRFETTLATLLPCDYWRGVFAGGFCKAGRKDAIFVDRSGVLPRAQPHVTRACKCRMLMCVCEQAKV
jgi:hypothetical protein